MSQPPQNTIIYFVLIIEGPSSDIIVAPAALICHFLLSVWSKLFWKPPWQTLVQTIVVFYIDTIKNCVNFMHGYQSPPDYVIEQWTIYLLGIYLPSRLQGH